MRILRSTDSHRFSNGSTATVLGSALAGTEASNVNEMIETGHENLYPELGNIVALSSLTFCSISKTDLKDCNKVEKRLQFAARPTTGTIADANSSLNRFT